VALPSAPAAPAGRVGQANGGSQAHHRQGGGKAADSGKWVRPPCLAVITRSCPHSTAGAIQAPSIQPHPTPKEHKSSQPKPSGPPAPSMRKTCPPEGCPRITRMASLQPACGVAQPKVRSLVAAERCTAPPCSGVTAEDCGVAAA
jgi:hypothetical protein